MGDVAGVREHDQQHAAETDHEPGRAQAGDRLSPSANRAISATKNGEELSSTAATAAPARSVPTLMPTCVSVVLPNPIANAQPHSRRVRGRRLRISGSISGQHRAADERAEGRDHDRRGVMQRGVGDRVDDAGSVIETARISETGRRS